MVLKVTFFKEIFQFWKANISEKCKMFQQSLLSMLVLENYREEEIFSPKIYNTLVIFVMG